MKIGSSFRYYLASNKKSMIAYYITMASVYVLVLLIELAVLVFSSSSVENTASIVSTGGFTGASGIFILVCGICFFRENFYMSLQNGISRRTLFAGSLCLAGAMAALMAVIDQLLTLLMRLISFLPHISVVSMSVLESVYAAQVSGMSPVPVALAAIAFGFCALLVVWSVGYFIGALFYRLSKLGKILVGVMAGLLFMVGLPVVSELCMAHPDWLIWKVLAGAANWIARVAFGSPWNAGISCLIIFAVFSALTWLLIRRAQLKKHQG